jgi:hypothetical protein
MCYICSSGLQDDFYAVLRREFNCNIYWSIYTYIYVCIYIHIYIPFIDRYQPCDYKDIAQYEAKKKVQLIKKIGR